MAANDNLRVLLVTSIGRDADLMEGALQAVEIHCDAFRAVEPAVEAIRSWDVGALVIAEERLDDRTVELLGAVLKMQPAWSALPVLILTMQSFSHSRVREWRRWPLGMTTLLERPIQVATLVSNVKAALLARSIQYERRGSIMALQQSEKLAAVGRLASSIAHEINNPLEAVTNLLYLLRETGLNPEQKGYLETAQQELARVSEIASQTLAFNRDRDARGEASMSTLLDSVLVLYHGRLAGSKISITRRYQHTAKFACYPGELRQVFVNLIGNAFDATRPGGRILLRERGAIHPKTGQRGVLVTLADTGEGMSAEVKADLFKPFKSSKGNNGSGLGLWISKGIVEKHCGSIWVGSSTRPGSSGTVFSIFLPFERRTHVDRLAAETAPHSNLRLISGALPLSSSLTAVVFRSSQHCHV